VVTVTLTVIHWAADGRLADVSGDPLTVELQAIVVSSDGD